MDSYEEEILDEEAEEVFNKHIDEILDIISKTNMKKYAEEGLASWSLRLYQSNFLLIAANEEIDSVKQPELERKIKSILNELQDHPSAVIIGTQYFKNLQSKKHLS